MVGDHAYHEASEPEGNMTWRLPMELFFAPIELFRADRIAELSKLERVWYVTVDISDFGGGSHDGQRIVGIYPSEEEAEPVARRFRGCCVEMTGEKAVALVKQFEELVRSDEYFNWL